MTDLEIQDRVNGYASLDQEIIRKLMGAEGFRPLTPVMQQRVLGQMIPSPSWLKAEASGSAIIVTNEWVVSVRGDSLEHCVAAMMQYRNAVAGQLGATVTGTLRTPAIDNIRPLHEVAARRESRWRLRGGVKTFSLLVAGALVSLVFTVVASLILGG
jgi:hypothetical protein